MIQIDNLQIEGIIAKHIEMASKNVVVIQAKKELNKEFGMNTPIYADTDSIKEIYHSGETHADVSRETFKLDKIDQGILMEIGSKCTPECGQLGCQDCFFKTMNVRYGKDCLLNQLDELRRKYS